MLRRIASHLFIVLAVLYGVVTSFAQIIYNPNDERFKQLALEKAIWVYLEKSDTYTRSESMRSKGLIAESEHLRNHQVFKIAEIELRQALLALTQETPHFVVVSATKSTTQGDETLLTLVITNAARLALTTELDSLLSTVSSDISLTDLRTIRNMHVSVMDSSTVIALPYEQTIDELLPGDTVSVSFVLLRDVDAVSVDARFSGRQERTRILLERATGGEELLITANPRSQEAEFGSTVFYGLRFIRRNTRTSVYDLEIGGLPAAIETRFSDVGTGAYVRRVVFPPASFGALLSLEVSLPDRSMAGLRADSMVEFSVRAIGADDNIVVSSVDVELLTRGSGMLVLTARNWSLSGSVESPPELSVDVFNQGSIALQDVRWDIRGPSEWVFSIEPGSIARIDADERAKVTIECHVPEDQSDGVFEYELRARSFTGTRWIESETKRIRVQLNSSGAGLSTALLILFALLVVGAVVYGTLRVSKR